MKIIILGNGYIANRIKDYGIDATIVDRQIMFVDNVVDILKEHKPDVVINAIGYVGDLNTMDCEQYPNRTLLSNTCVPILIFEACLKQHVKMVHISSACLFDYNYDNQFPIAEQAMPDWYKLLYARSKIYSDQALYPFAFSKKLLMIRLRIPLDKKRHNRNLLDKLIRYKKVIDLPNSVTYMPDFVAALKHLIAEDATGVYNVMSKGSLFYPDLMNEYKKYDPDFEFEVIDGNELRRTNILLDISKLTRLYEMPNINDRIKECVEGWWNDK